MPRFVIFPRETADTFQDFSPAEMQALIERYIAWTGRMTESGVIEYGHKLVDGAGRVVRGGAGGAPSVTDGPFAEVAEVVGGLWVAQAEDYDALVAHLADCPHLEYGSLEVRELEADVE